MPEWTALRRPDGTGSSNDQDLMLIYRIALKNNKIPRLRRGIFNL